MTRPCHCDRAQCRLCTLYHQDLNYRRLWSGEKAGLQVPVDRAFQRLPCVLLGEVLLRRHSTCRRNDVHLCGKGHGKVTPNGFCEICPDYQPES